MTRRQTRILASAIVAGMAMVLATVAGSGAQADHDDLSLRVRLSGYQEDPQPLSTKASGRFQARLSEDGKELSYSLSYTGFEGNVTQAHIHFGGRAQAPAGNIIVFLCTNQGNSPGTQPCPAAPATITGTITAANIIGPAGAGIAVGEFEEFVAAVRAGVTYVNVHSSTFPGGEIRGQLDHRH